MKRKAVITGMFVALLFFQINHVGLMAFSNPHGASMACAGAKKTGATEKCFCCALQQADKSSSLNIYPVPPSLNLTHLVDFHFDAPSFESLKSHPSQFGISQNKWLQTIVQHK